MSEKLEGGGYSFFIFKNLWISDRSVEQGQDGANQEIHFLQVPFYGFKRSEMIHFCF